MSSAETSTTELWGMEELIDDAKRKVSYAESKFLRAAGWIYTCSTPGAFWLWQKTLPDGRTALVEQNMAVILQCRMMPETEESHE